MTAVRVWKQSAMALFTFAFLVTAPSIALSESRGASPPRNPNWNIIADSVSKGKDICSVVGDMIRSGQSVVDTVEDAILMGHSACVVVRCALESGAKLEDVMAAAFRAGASPDIVVTCSIQGGATPDAVTSIITRLCTPGYGYTPPRADVVYTPTFEPTIGGGGGGAQNPVSQFRP